MRTIYKYPFAVRDEVSIDMPDMARILHVDSTGAGNFGCIWALLPNDQYPTVERRFRLYGTGNKIDLSTSYLQNHIGTFMDGPFVWHMFEIAPSRDS